MERKTKLKILTLFCLGTMTLASCGQNPSHNYEEHAAVAATCEKAGNKKYYTCKDDSCKGKYFNEEKKEIQWSEIEIAALGHDYGDPTYTWNNDSCHGEIACKRQGCGKKIEETKTGTKVVDVESTCLVKEEYHYHVEFDNKDLKTADSNKIEGELGDHDVELVAGQPETCTANGWKDAWKCKHCGIYFSDSAHKKRIGDENAYKTWKTIGDGKIAKHPHSTSKVAGQAETCTVDGWKDAWKCSECGNYFEEESAATLIGNEAAYNTWKTTDGKGKKAKHAHTLTKIDGKKETCTADGWKDAWKCSECSNYFSDSQGTTLIGDETAYTAWKTGDGKIAAHHNYGTLIEKVDKNRGTDGMEAHYVCADCGQYFDKDKNPTTAEALKIANTLHDVAETTATGETDYITFSWDISKTLYLDVLVDSDTQGIYIGFMDKNNGWKRTSNVKIKKDGSISFTDNPEGTTETKEGAYVLGKTTDGYVRVKFDLTKMTQEEGFKEVTDILIYKWAHSSGKIDINPSANIKTNEFVLLDNKTFTGGSASNYDLPTKILKDDGKLIVTLNFTDQTKKDARFIFREGWGDNCIGRFIIYNDGSIESGQTYPGLAIEVLETNKVKVTIDLKIATGETGYKTGSPSYFNLFQFNKYGAGSGTCSVSFQANDLVY